MSQIKPTSPIKRRREAAGLTQAELAEKVGVSEFTVQKWETGKRNPRVSYLRKAAVVLKCRPADLL